MQDEPELLVPISELHWQRDDLLAQADPSASHELTGWRLGLWRGWTILGALTVLPMAFGALFIRRSDPNLAWGIFIVFGCWLVIAYWTNPLARSSLRR